MGLKNEAHMEKYYVGVVPPTNKDKLSSDPPSSSPKHYDQLSPPPPTFIVKA